VCGRASGGEARVQSLTRTLKFTIAYDGSSFVGWQRQADGESIQGVLEDVLAKFEGAPVVVHGAGRTDAGVHALGQVASVRLGTDLDEATLVRAVNAQLPESVRVLKIEDVADDFHARFSATSKTYRYVIGRGELASPFTRGFTWHIPDALDVMAMRRAARHLVGRHDFSAFRSVGGGSPDSVRTVTRAEVLAVGATGSTSIWGAGAPVLAVEVAADGFLRHMVRAITGTLVEVGRGWRDPESMSMLVSGVTRSEAGATAPPQGLFLVRVDYDQGACAR
jgi:tRNA pseudouridine38-40 synthase